MQGLLQVVASPQVMGAAQSREHTVMRLISNLAGQDLISAPPSGEPADTGGLSAIVRTDTIVKTGEPHIDASNVNRFLSVLVDAATAVQGERRDGTVAPGTLRLTTYYECLDPIDGFEISGGVRLSGDVDEDAMRLPAQAAMESVAHGFRSVMSRRQAEGWWVSTYVGRGDRVRLTVGDSAVRGKFGFNRQVELSGIVQSPFEPLVCLVGMTALARAGALARP